MNVAERVDDLSQWLRAIPVDEREAYEQKARAVRDTLCREPGIRTSADLILTGLEALREGRAPESALTAAFSIMLASGSN